MQTITTTTSRSSFLAAGPRVVERTRGSAHPKVPATRRLATAHDVQRAGLARAR
jgi:hypothetical protein